MPSHMPWQTHGKRHGKAAHMPDTPHVDAHPAHPCASNATQAQRPFNRGASTPLGGAMAPKKQAVAANTAGSKSQRRGEALAPPPLPPDVVAIPVHVPPPAPVGVQEQPRKPQLPGADADPDVLPLMRGIIASASHDLRRHMAEDTAAFAAFADVPLHEHEPLEIKATASDRELLSYKPPWKHEAAQTSLANTGLYEASGNLFWVNPFPASAQATVCAGETPPWSAVMGMSDAFRPDDAATFKQPDATAREKRISPGHVGAPCLDVGGFDKATFKGTLQLVTGHPVIYGWYVAMREALSRGDNRWIASLVQAAVTVTLRGDVCLDARLGEVVDSLVE